MHTTPSKRRRRGFSLIELLAVITIIGLLASIAVLSLSKTDYNSRVTVAKTNAQRVASTFSMGQAAGAPGFAVVTDVEAAIDAVGIGSSGSGVNGSSFFQLPGVSSDLDEGKPAEQQVRHYLKWQSGLLAYDSTGSAQ